MEYDVQNLVELRQKLASLRIELRELNSSLQRTRILTENRAIEYSGGSYGKNADERERFLKNSLLECEEYNSLENRILITQNEIDATEALIECQRDLRREREYVQNESLINEGKFNKIGY